ncbi:hypothetical protein Pcinc_023593 [Petrolisthes cinctipes]|uniref:Uncharacterized protein n=1 Tax=Petrolisthes cinctipes TaxID=88211 RepID=A0AAE1KFL0_PETCI|nr:hypothetical protein Pcinc_023593 [Petrolisthes cinctipes]
MLLKVNTNKDVLTHLNHPTFWPWGVDATIRVAVPPGVLVKRACGRGVFWDGNCIRVPCLSGRPLLGLELYLHYTKITHHPETKKLLHAWVNIQLLLNYTDTMGNLVSVVYHRRLFCDSPHYESQVAHLLEMLFVSDPPTCSQHSIHQPQNEPHV